MAGAIDYCRIESTRSSSAIVAITPPAVLPVFSAEAKLAAQNGHLVPPVGNGALGRRPLSPGILSRRNG
jgi:hypothetical protein